MGLQVAERLEIDRRGLVSTKRIQYTARSPSVVKKIRETNDGFAMGLTLEIHVIFQPVKLVENIVRSAPQPLCAHLG